MPRTSKPLIVIGAIILIFIVHSIFFSDAPSNVRDGDQDALHRKLGLSFGTAPNQRSRANVKAASNFNTKSKKQSKQKSRVGGGQHAGKTTGSSRDRDGENSSGSHLPIDRKGLLNYDPQSPDWKRSKHPVELLIEKGKRDHQELEARLRGITELRDAVEDYEKGWGMRPPRGFEYWYKFAQSQSPPSPALPTIYPTSHLPFLTFLSHPASLLRQRVQDYRNDKSVFTFTFVPDGEGDVGTDCEVGCKWVSGDAEKVGRRRGRIRVRGSGAWKFRSNNTLTLLLPILPLLPPEIFTLDPPLEIAYSWDDGPRGMVHNTFRERSEVLARAGKVWPKAQLYKAEQNMRWTYGWQWSCPADTPLKVQSTDLLLNDLVHEQAMGLDGNPGKAVKTFIGDWERSADYCENPDLMNLHNILLLDAGKAAVEVVPVLATCRTMWNSDLLGVPLDGVWENVDYIPFEKKTIGKAFWRGSATGLAHSKKTPWRQSQRERLHYFTHNKTAGSYPLLVDRTSQGNGLELEQWDIAALNERYTDAGLSGGAVQCEDTETCKEMEQEIDFMQFVRKEDSPKYRYVLDIDGNGWSSRFRRLLRGNNVVFKSTIYPEWFHGQLIPWYHYVPLKLDYTDLYDIMAFFEGAPDGSSPGRLDLAQEIAEQSYKFTQERWRMEDMQSYTFLTILEYWRMMTDDREEGSYNAIDSME